MDAEKLRELFLPELTSEGEKLIRQSKGAFIPGQLKHYGIEFENTRSKSKAIDAMKSALETGKVRYDFM
jgi:hypothetical protein